MADELVAAYTRDRAPHPLVDGALETMEKLSGYTFYVVTDKTRKELEAAAEESCFPLERITGIITSDIVGRKKPSPEVLRYALEAVSEDTNFIKGSEIHYVFDSLDEIEMIRRARTMGIETVKPLITWQTGPNAREEFLNANVNREQLIGTVARLPNALGL